MSSCSGNGQKENLPEEDSNLGLHFSAFLLESLHFFPLLLERFLEGALALARLDLLDRRHHRLDLEARRGIF